MRNLCGHVRSAIYEELNGRISYGGSYVPVYSSPPQTLTFPCIIIGEQSWEVEEFMYMSKIIKVITTIIVITRPGIGAAATYEQADSITTSIVDDFEGELFVLSEGCPGIDYFNANDIKFVNGYIEGGNINPVVDNDGLTIQSKLSLILKFEEDK